MKPCRINGKIFEWIVVSRRSCFRAGVRYFVRGMNMKVSWCVSIDQLLCLVANTAICSWMFPALLTGIDSEGHAANFVETEQIVLYEGAKASFVQARMRVHCPEAVPASGPFTIIRLYLQTRGSMPFYWSQRPNLKYKPKPIISKTTNHVRLDLMDFSFVINMKVCC